MSRALPRTPARVVAVAALALALTGCGAGFEAQTYQERALPDGTNAATGSVAVRNVQLLAPRGDVYDRGDDAEGAFTLVNVGGEDDRLVEITSPAAESVDIVEIIGSGAARTVSSVEVSRLGTTGNRYGFVLRDLSEELRSGEYVELTLRFERGGEVTLQAPVITTEEYDYERERSVNFHVPGEEGGGEH